MIGFIRVSPVMGFDSRDRPFKINGYDDNREARKSVLFKLVRFCCFCYLLVGNSPSCT